MITASRNQLIRGVLVLTAMLLYATYLSISYHSRVVELTTELETSKRNAEMYQIFRDMGMDRYCVWAFENDRLELPTEEAQ